MLPQRTPIGDPMLQRSHLGGWGNPAWDDETEASGGIRPGEGQLLYGLVCALMPKVILEIGTGHGYSTIHLAEGCRHNGLGIVHTVEKSDVRRAAAANNIYTASLLHRVIQYKEIPTLAEVDLAFLDAEHTTEAVEAYLNRLPDNCKVALVHDADWNNHAQQAAEITHWSYSLLRGTSECGIAILTR